MAWSTCGPVVEAGCKSAAADCVSSAAVLAVVSCTMSAVIPGPVASVCRGRTEATRCGSVTWSEHRCKKAPLFHVMAATELGAVNLG